MVNRLFFSMRLSLAVLLVIGLHGGFWLLLTSPTSPRLPSTYGTLIVQLISDPAPMLSDRPPEKVPVLSIASVPVSPVSLLSLPPVQPEVDIREILQDELPPGTVLGEGYWDAQQVDQRASALADLLPVYPPSAFKQREHGRVLVEILIGAQGGIDALRIVAATTGFAASALAAFDGMHFDPAVLGGRAVASRLLVELTYRLNEHIVTTTHR
ncbi:MAG: TonB family protein [Candidatus Paceibacteria bacterium]